MSPPPPGGAQTVSTPPSTRDEAPTFPTPAIIVRKIVRLDEASRATTPASDEESSTATTFTEAAQDNAMADKIFGLMEAHLHGEQQRQTLLEGLGTCVGGSKLEYYKNRS